MRWVIIFAYIRRNSLIDQLSFFGDERRSSSFMGAFGTDIWDAVEPLLPKHVKNFGKRNFLPIKLAIKEIRRSLKFWGGDA